MSSVSESPLAWVSGSSSGIGLAIARNLIEQGYRVVGLDKNLSTWEHPNYCHQVLNLANRVQLQTWLSSFEATQGEANLTLAFRRVPDAIVHAAGLMHTATLGQLSVEAGEQMWLVHVQAASLIANTLLPMMAKAAQQGSVLTPRSMLLIGSRVAGGMPGRSQYAATKAALVALMRSWASEVIADGITVNMISPAATDTAMIRDGTRQSSSPRLPPIGRLIDPQEIADLAFYLLSDRARAITGQDIMICGGASLPT
jgi:3-oxoacyl-[acyl-carrier protein] reductase